MARQTPIMVQSVFETITYWLKQTSLGFERVLKGVKSIKLPRTQDMQTYS